MVQNRSNPAHFLLPHLCYKDVATAIDWLRSAFGFVEEYRFGDPTDGALVHLGEAWILLQSEYQHRKSPATLGAVTASLSVFVEDVEGHCARAQAAGATILNEPRETEFGEFEYRAVDHEGHLWTFSRHARDLKPEDWGARTANPPE
jgi:uncharacterized glyoxalase superfamily protein PhnB